MAQRDLDLILNPMRMRIVQYLLLHQPATTQEIGEALSDIPPASLYRHVGKLLEGDIIKIDSEAKIRGAVRRSYVVNTESEKLYSGSSDKQNDFLAIYSLLMEILKNFQSYAQREDSDLAKDGYFVNTAMLHLTDEDYRGFLDELKTFGKTVEKYADLPQKPGGKLRRFNIIASPVEKKR